VRELKAHEIYLASREGIRTVRNRGGRPKPSVSDVRGTDVQDPVPQRPLLPSAMRFAEVEKLAAVGGEKGALITPGLG